MGLYLCVFDGDDEIEGVEVGSYEDFGTFRDTVRDSLEHGDSGSRFPVLMKHSDCDGMWTPREAEALHAELTLIAQEFASRPCSSRWRLEEVCGPHDRIVASNLA